ncbi:MAG: PACE efflux transporter [Thiotrichales bacterium]|jgi:uncharacterized membrane protein|nr:PACE efflux transporter [Thiotrichales bacterium]
MTTRQRKIWQAVLYEIGAVILVTPLVVWAFDHDLASSFWLSVVMSTIAVAWSYGFNSLFEAWESKQVVKGRNWQRRLVHSVGFEGGLALFFVPLIAWWLSVGWWVAFITDASLLLVFFVYSIVFTWLFDRVFGLPASAKSP